MTCSLCSVPFPDKNKTRLTATVRGQALQGISIATLLEQMGVQLSTDEKSLVICYHCRMGLAHIHSKRQQLTQILTKFHDQISVNVCLGSKLKPIIFTLMESASVYPPPCDQEVTTSISSSPASATPASRVAPPANLTAAQTPVHIRLVKGVSTMHQSTGAPVLPETSGTAVPTSASAFRCPQAPTETTAPTAHAPSANSETPCAAVSMSTPASSHPPAPTETTAPLAPSANTDTTAPPAPSKRKSVSPAAPTRGRKQTKKEQRIGSVMGTAKPPTMAFKVSSVTVPGDKSRTLGLSAVVFTSSDTLKGWVRMHRTNGEAPSVTGKAPSVTAKAPKVSAKAPKVSAKAPANTAEASKVTLQATTSAPLVVAWPDRCRGCGLSWVSGKACTVATSPDTCGPIGQPPAKKEISRPRPRGLHYAANYIRHAEYSKAMNVLLTQKAFIKQLHRSVSTLIYKEVRALCRNKSSVWRASLQYADGKEFNWKTATKAMKEECPLLYTALHSTSTAPENMRYMYGKPKPSPALRPSPKPSLAVVFGLLLHLHHPGRMRIIQQILGLQLWLGDCSPEVMKKLEWVGLCTPHDLVTRSLVPGIIRSSQLALDAKKRDIQSSAKERPQEMFLLQVKDEPTTPRRQEHVEMEEAGYGAQTGQGADHGAHMVNDGGHGAHMVKDGDDGGAKKGKRADDGAKKGKRADGGAKKLNNCHPGGAQKVKDGNGGAQKVNSGKHGARTGQEADGGGAHKVNDGDDGGAQRGKVANGGDAGGTKEGKDAESGGGTQKGQDATHARGMKVEDGDHGDAQDADSDGECVTMETDDGGSDSESSGDSEMKEQREASRCGYSLVFADINNSTQCLLSNGLAGMKHIKNFKKDNLVKMVQLCATTDRIPTMHLDDTVTSPEKLLAIDPSVFLPTSHDLDVLWEEYVIVIQRILCNAMSCFKKVRRKIVTHIPHQYTEESQRQSQLIPLGTTLKNQTKPEDMVDILEAFHQHVPGGPGPGAPGRADPVPTLPGTTIPGAPGSADPVPTLPGTTVPGATIPGAPARADPVPTLPGATVPGATIPGAPARADPVPTLPGATVPGATIPGAPGRADPVPTLLYADAPGCQRVRAAQRTRSGGETPWERLEALHPVMDEWHKHQAVLEETYKLLYDIKSAYCMGSLAFIRQRFMHNRLYVNVLYSTQHAIDLLRLSTEAYVVACACSALGLQDPKEMPEDFLSERAEALEELQRVATVVAGKAWQPALTASRGEDVYCVCGTEKEGETMVQCEHAACDRGSWFHLVCLESSVDLEGTWFCSDRCSAAAASAGALGEDHVHEYTRALLNRGLGEMVRHDAVCENDGDRMLMHWKLDMLDLFLADEGTRLSEGTSLSEGLRLLTDVSGGVSRRMAHQLVWNRTVNLTGGPGQNVVMNACIDKVNKHFEEAVRSEGHSRTNIERNLQVSRMLRMQMRMDDMLGQPCNIRFSLAFLKKKKKADERERKRDIAELAGLLLAHDVVSDIEPGRAHVGFSGFRAGARLGDGRGYLDRVEEYLRRRACGNEQVA